MSKERNCCGSIPSFNEFRSAYSPKNIATMVRQNKAGLYQLPHPTVKRIAGLYGVAGLQLWLTDIVEYMAKASGLRDKIDCDMEMLAMGVLNEHESLKASELLHWAYLHTTGNYSQFFGVVDCRTVMLTLRQYKESDCKDLRDAYRMGKAPAKPREIDKCQLPAYNPEVKAKVDLMVQRFLQWNSAQQNWRSRTLANA